MLDKTFRLRTDNANLQWLQRQRHISHHQTCWLNLLAEHQPRVVHIPNRTNPAGFLALERFPGGPGLVHHTGDDSALGPFTASGSAPASALVTTGPAAESTRFVDRPAPVHAILRLFTRLFAGVHRPPYRACVAAGSVRGGRRRIPGRRHRDGGAQLARVGGARRAVRRRVLVRQVLDGTARGAGRGAHVVATTPRRPEPGRQRRRRRRPALLCRRARP